MCALTFDVITLTLNDVRAYTAVDSVSRQALLHVGKQTGSVDNIGREIGITSVLYEY